MPNKTKKHKIKYWIIGIITCLFFGLIVTTTVFLTINQKKTQTSNDLEKPLPQTILDHDEVLKNFATGGKWEKKTYLDSSDLSQYKSITSDAFDGDNIPLLDYVELPDTLMLAWFDFLYEGITWKNVNDIRCKNTCGIGFFELNNILFYKSDDLLKTAYAISIANRKIKNDIIFPYYYFSSKSSYNDNYTQLNINYSINFPDFNKEEVKYIFRNVKKIGFYPNNHDNGKYCYSISYFGLFNCNKLQDNIELYNDSFITFLIGLTNTNIQSFDYYDCSYTLLKNIPDTIIPDSGSINVYKHLFISNFTSKNLNKFSYHQVECNLNKNFQNNCGLYFIRTNNNLFATQQTNFDFSLNFTNQENYVFFWDYLFWDHLYNYNISNSNNDIKSNSFLNNIDHKTFDKVNINISSKDINKTHFSFENPYWEEDYIEKNFFTFIIPPKDYIEDFYQYLYFIQQYFEYLNFIEPFDYFYYHLQIITNMHPINEQQLVTNFLETHIKDDGFSFTTNLDKEIFKEQLTPEHYNNIKIS